MSNRASGDEAAAAEIAGFIEADKEAVCLVPFFEVGGAEAVGGLLPQTAIHGEPIDQDGGPMLADVVASEDRAAGPPQHAAIAFGALQLDHRHAGFQALAVRLLERGSNQRRPSERGRFYCTKFAAKHCS